MALLLFANDATGQLAGAISNTAVSVTLQAGQGALFPNPGAGYSFVATFVDAATGLLTEIVSCTARSSDTITIIRAQESTTALNWNAGDFFSNLWTAGSAAQMLQQGQAPASQIFYGASDTGSVNAIVTTVSPTLGALADGQVFEIQPAYSNTSATVTVNTSGAGAISGYRFDGTPLQPNDYIVGSRTLWAYKASGPSMYLLNPATWKSASPSTVGDARGLKGSAAGGSVTASWSAAELFVETALGGLAYKAVSQTFNFNGATTGAGGMDTGTFPSGAGDLSVYAIYNPSTLTWSTLGTVASSGPVYSGSNMPSGYTASALLWTGKTAGGSITAFGQVGRYIIVNNIQVLNSGAGSTSLVSVSVSTVVPGNAVSCSGFMASYSSSSTGSEPAVSSSSTGLGQCSGGTIGISLPSGNTSGLTFINQPLLTSQTLWWSSTQTSETVQMNIFGYNI